MERFMDLDGEEACVAEKRKLVHRFQVLIRKPSFLGGFIERKPKEEVVRNFAL